MRETLEAKCRLFISNRDVIKSNFAWESAYMQPLSASMFTEKNRGVNVERMEQCKELLRQQTGLFSNFRGNIRLAAISLLALDENPEERLKNTLSVYEKLKKEFFSSTYLPVASLMITGIAKPEEYDNIIKRTRHIYELMKEEHPFLTSGEDSSFAALLAMSEKSDEELIMDMEECYNILKCQFFSGNAVQSLSHVLTLGQESAEEKCRCAMEIFEGLRTQGYRYGTNYELATLGVLALLNTDVEQLIGDMIEVDEYLREQRGFGIFGIGSKQRLMYAGILVADEYIKNGEKYTMHTATINGALSIMIAQQTAMCAAVAASAAAASSASS